MKTTRPRMKKSQPDNIKKKKFWNFWKRKSSAPGHRLRLIFLPQEVITLKNVVQILTNHDRKDKIFEYAAQWGISNAE